MKNRIIFISLALFIVKALLVESNAADTSQTSTVDQLLVWGNKNQGALLARATNEEAVEYGRLFYETTDFLGKSNPKLCMQYILPSMYGPIQQEEWPKQFLSRQMALQRKIINSALKTPNTIPSEKEAGPLLDAMMQEIRKKYGDKTVDILSKPNNNYPNDVNCVAWSRLYSAMSSLPSNQAGTLIRWFNAP